jgi:hypothetical protein
VPKKSEDQKPKEQSRGTTEEEPRAERELGVEELEERIAPRLAQNQNETLFAG